MQKDKKIMEEMNKYADEFNTIVIDLLNGIGYILPNTIIGKHLTLAKSMISDIKNKTKFVELFIVKVLPHKKEIMKGNEEFFINKSYDEEFEDKSLIENIFKFKSIWKDINKENKKMIIEYMKILCMLSQEYFNLYDSQTSK